MNTAEFERHALTHKLDVKWYWAYWNSEDALERIGAKIAYPMSKDQFDFYDIESSRESDDARATVLTRALIGNKYAIHALEIVSHYNPKYRDYRKLVRILKRKYKEDE